MEKTAYEEYVAGKDVNLTADSDSVKSYLADMGNIELLSASDENRLSERILRGQCVLALKKEQDKADILGKNIFEINGLMISSPQFSSSSNIRMLGQVIDEYTKEVRKQVYELGFPMAKAFQELYKEKGTGEKVFRN